MSSHSLTRHCVVVLGDAAVGKTSLTIRQCLDIFKPPYDPTIHDTYTRKLHLDGQAFHFDVLDTAGMEECIPLPDTWKRDGDGFIVVYDTTCRQSLARVSYEVDSILRVKGAQTLELSHLRDDSHPSTITLDSNPKRPPIMIVGNKIDLVEERTIATEEGHALAQRLRCEFMETSAKTGENVNEAFHDVLRQIRHRKAREAWQSAATPEDDRTTQHSRRASKRYSRRRDKCAIQ